MDQFQQVEVGFMGKVLKEIKGADFLIWLHALDWERWLRKCILHLIAGNAEGYAICAKLGRSW
jgi:hypothetical protein